LYHQTQTKFNEQKQPLVYGLKRRGRK